MQIYIEYKLCSAIMVVEIFLVVMFSIGRVQGFGLQTKGGEMGGTNVKFPYGNDCEYFTLGGSDGDGRLQTPLVDMRDGSELAFYPMTDGDTKLNLKIKLPKTTFKVSIEGSMLRLEKCKNFRACTLINEEGVKYPSYITSQDWNIVRISLHNQMLKIIIGARMVKSMSMTSYGDINKAQWFVQGQTPATKSKTISNDQYLVQFKCKEYDHEEENAYLTTTPEPPIHMYYDTTTSEPKYPKTTILYHDITPELRNDLTSNIYSGVTEAVYGEAETTVEPTADKSSSHVGLIVGLICAALIVIALVIVIYYVVSKKQSSVTLNETTPLEAKK